MTPAEEAELKALEQNFSQLVETPAGKQIWRLLELYGQQSLEWSAMHDIVAAQQRAQGGWLLVQELARLRD